MSCRSRRKNCGAKLKLNDDKIRDYVVDKLCDYWTPEEIAGRAKFEKKPFTISYNTIYRAIDSGELPKQLKANFRYKRRGYKCNKASDNRGKIPNTTSIHERPAGAKNRTRFGHWESDTVFGKRSTGCIGTHVESAFIKKVHFSEVPLIVTICNNFSLIVTKL
jgi:IS30 family transposase